jgi:cell division protein FtsX
MTEELKTTEGKLWEEFKRVFPDSEENINKKDEILKKINEVRKAQGLQEWNKWTKEEALKKLQEGVGRGKFFPSPRKTEVKIDETNKFHEIIRKIYETEVLQDKRKEQTFEHWRLDNLHYLALLVEVFNGQTKQK